MAFVYPTLSVKAQTRDYNNTIIARDGLEAYWRLGESSGVSAADASGHGKTGTYNGPTLGTAGATADGDTAVTFDGANDYVSAPNLGLTSSFSIEAWVYYTGAGSTGATEYGTVVGYSPTRRLLIRDTGSVLAQIGGHDFFASTTIASNTWVYIVYTYDLAGNLETFYINGVASGTSTPVSQPTWVGAFRIGDYDGSNYLFKGRLDEIAFYSRVLTAAEVAEIYASASTDGWFEIAADTVGDSGLHVKYGIDGSGPLARVASTGEMSVTMQNWAKASTGRPEGYYSPNHASVRSGWMFGIATKVVFTYGAVDYTKFRGKIRVIDPEPGRYGGRKVGVIAYDIMRDLAETDAREVTIQVNKTETELLNALIDILPANAQPVATDFDAGVDAYPYAFDDVAGGTKALSVMRDVVVSGFGLLAQKGDGTLIYRTRHGIATSISAYSITDAEFFDLSVPSSLDGVYDRARATNHPKQVSAVATDDLYTLPPGTSVEIPAGATDFEIWTDYTDPNDRQTNIGGTSVVTVLVAGTHYAANAQADGLGADKTAFTTPTITPFGSTAKWTFTNTDTASIFLTTQTVIGKAVRDPGPQTYQAYAPMAYGDRPIEIDLPYQDDPYIGQSVADYVVSIYSELSQQINSVSFVANKSDALMVQALTREIGDRITLTEQVTGVTAVDAIIQSVDLEVKPGRIVICTWGLAPADTTRYWQLGIAGASELGATTVVGF